MRKRNIAKVADTIMWTLIYLLPLILYVIYIITLGRSDYKLIDENGNYIGGTQVWGLSTVLNRMGFWITIDRNPIYLAIANAIGNNGILPLFNNNSSVIAYISYVGSCVILHLFIDVLLFIPRWAHTMMNKFKEEE